MSLEKTIYLNQLLSYYGSLLTDRQLSMMQSYYEEDLSLSEIADYYEISRQAVHDNIKRSEKLLVSYEEKLRILAKSNDRLKYLKEIRPMVEGQSEILEKIDYLIQLES
ncbi:YlxM family DNA-binding protein [Facklamia sp. 7083-14-GEN3]|uniref:YlxM family DNA-binding protein n=1 Tax=Facklamia sp. 7083-14-GEN3 TaxID=2973478 RepID=UPI00215C8860|nr:YlxM family DNA-binding protein [Facklamia sp. 7083-14-GEN3]MCR8968764.1 YlxM family DNA-binding protein [Facklamia sp. 7083-14-GEN3]